VALGILKEVRGMAGVKDLPKVEAVLRVRDGKFVVLNLHKYREFIQLLSLTGKIHEGDYLQKYPDVTDALRSKQVKSATDHYVKWGYFENVRPGSTLSHPLTAPNMPPAQNPSDASLAK
jgi:hypothetical protein